MHKKSPLSIREVDSLGGTKASFLESFCEVALLNFQVEIIRGEGI